LNGDLAATPPRFAAWKLNLLVIAAGFAGVYAIIGVDVTLRARRAFLEGEKFMAWHRNPELKKQVLDKDFLDKKAELELQKAKNALPEDEYRRRLDDLEFDREFLMQESSVKYAYQWYKDAYELFTPPSSRWSRLAREKAPEALSLWKQELSEKKIPFENLNLE
jgi:hypothetical protein